MRLVLVTFILTWLSATPSFAQKMFPSDLEYKEVFHSGSADLSKIDQAMAKMGYMIVAFRGEASPYFTIDWADRIYALSSGTFVILKANLEPSLKVSTSELLQAPGAYVGHVIATPGKYHVLYFSGFKTRQAEQVLNQLNSGQSSAAFQLLVPRAFADDLPPSACEPKKPGALNFPFNSPGLRQDWSCLKGLAGGVWDATGGAVVMIGDGIGHLVRHPLKTMESVTLEYLKIAYFVWDFPIFFGPLRDDFRKLPQDIQTKLICEVAGAVSTGALVTAVSAGVGTPSLMSSIAGVVEKLSAVTDNVNYLKFAEKFEQKYASTAGKVFDLGDSFERRFARLEKREEKLTEEANELDALREHIRSCRDCASNTSDYFRRETDYNREMRELDRDVVRALSDQQKGGGYIVLRTGTLTPAERAKKAVKVIGCRTLESLRARLRLAEAEQSAHASSVGSQSKRSN